MSRAATPVLLSVRDLRLAVMADDPQVVVDSVSFDVSAGEVLAIVGESGCGKTVTALSILRLIEPAIRAVGGSILWNGEDLLQVGRRRLRQVRGGEIAMIFQEPMTSLNPVLTIGYQIAESVRIHQSLGRRAARVATIELLSMVGIPSAARRVDDYPHQMSGGMRQRAMIALALACRPRLLIADEPTTALDVTIQAQIVELLKTLQRQLGMAVIMITHDLGLVSGIADHVAVMYAGRLVEQSPAAALFAHPRHPYTERLLASIPPVDRDVERLESIPGAVPQPWAMPRGCRFAPRCRRADSLCVATDPATVLAGPGHLVACHYPLAHSAASVMA